MNAAMHAPIKSVSLITVALLTASLTLPAHAAAKKKPLVNQTATSSAAFTNKLGMAFVNIPSGSFIMGSCPQSKKDDFLGKSQCNTPDPDVSSNETPQHQVSIKAFQLAQTEVTLGQFKTFIKATNNRQLVDDDFVKYNAYGDNAPVVQVSWHDAQAFINWLNEKEGGGYRLPSEAEWEYACKAGGNTKYCGGNNASAVAWYEGNGKHQQPVATKQANAWGLYDMSGNVWEWVQDGWHDNYNGAPTDGSAWTGSDYRVLRGGAWGNGARSLRAADRGISTPADRGDIGLGFRLARTLP